MIKDAADLFAARGEQARDVIEYLKNEAKDSLDLAFSEAPKGSARERYRYVREHIFPLLARIEDAGERGAALKDVAKSLDLGMRELRAAFEEFEDGLRPLHESDEDGGEDEDLIPEPGTERHQRAMEILRDPNIPQRAAQTVERLGHVGEWLAKMLAFVCAISARAGYPIQPSTHAESSTGKNYLWDTVLMLLPVKMVLRWSAMSDKALFFTQEDLKGKVIYLQEVAGSEGADFTIRVLQSAQYLEYVVTEKTADGTYRAVTYRKEGPVVVVQTTTQIRLYNENDSRVLPIHLDESSEQTARIVDRALLQAESGGVSHQERELILRQWHDAILLLETAEVVVPFARRIEMPAHRVRVRRDVNRLLDVIRVHAWLHQHCRERDELGRILATEDDFEAALGLVSDSLKRAWEELSPAEEAVMEAINSLPVSTRKNGFKRSELQIPGQDTRRVQQALKALTETGYIECEKRGGPGGYRYTVPRDREKVGLGISLRSSDDEGAAEADGDNEDGEEEDEEECGSRESARNDVRAIEGGVLRGEDAIARSREEDDEDDFEGDGFAEDEDDVDHIAELTDLGWYRAQTAFAAGDVPEDYPVDEDPVGRWLRHHTPIYYGPHSEEFLFCWPAKPLAFSAEELVEVWAKGDPQEDRRPTPPWPSTPEEASRRVNRVVPVLQAEAHRFWDPGRSSWYITELLCHPYDTEEVCSEAYLHAELWKNEVTQERLWVLIALREGWRAPDGAIEEAVWRRVTFGPRTWEDNVLESSSEEDTEFEL